MMYKKLVIAFLLTEILFMSAVVYVNYTVDPANIFNANDHITGMGNIILRGENVAYTKNYNERLFQKYIIDNVPYSLDALAIGSSRTMGITEAFFPGERVFNHSVSGASSEDYIALIFALKQKKGLPKKIVFGLDPWILNVNNGASRWQSLKDDFEIGMAELGISGKTMKKIHIEKYYQLISLPYLNASLRALKNSQQERKYYATKEIFLKDNVRTKEGALVYGKDFRERTKAIINEKAREYIQGDVYAIESFTELDKDLKIRFERLMLYLLRNDVEVIFYLPPYHPIVYNYLANNEKYKMVFKGEDYFRKFAKEHNIKVVGSYNPDECGCIDTDFYDGMHMKREKFDSWLKCEFVGKEAL